MDGVDEPCSPTPPTGQHQHQKRTCDVLQMPDIFTRSRQRSGPTRLGCLQAALGCRDGGRDVCINMIHIAPWAATTALMAGAARLLPPTGVLVLHGPYRREGRHTAPSNEAFARHLRASTPDWGVRDLEAVTEAAAS